MFWDFGSLYHEALRRPLRQLLRQRQTVSVETSVACVGLFVSFVTLLDKPVEDFSIRSFGSASIQWTDGREQCESLE